MDVLILRHGDAAHEARSDWERCLTARGHEELRAILSSCRGDLSAVSRMLVSPYVRAQQSAKIAAEYLQPSVVTQTSELLVPEADPAKLLDHLYHLQQEQLQSVLLVGHQPLIGVLLDRLCGFEVGRYRMGTSALASVAVDVVAKGMGRLRWLHQPSDVL